MIWFNTLLAENDFDPKSVQLVRHQQRGDLGRSPYTLWRSNSASSGQFEWYQRLQRRAVFRRDWLASFIVSPSSETIFIGMYRNDGHERSRKSVNCPVTGKTFDPGDMFVYELSPVDRLCDLSGKLVIEWGAGYRSWVQRADRMNKQVTELRRVFSEPEFPGFDKFFSRIENISDLHQGWSSALSAVRGVYLLTFDDGQQYIGSATGESGFLQRWHDYLVNGHGGNRVLRGRDARLATVSILETAGNNETREDIVAKEMLWKRRLGPKAIVLDEHE